VRGEVSPSGDSTSTAVVRFSWVLLEDATASGMHLPRASMNDEGGGAHRVNRP
jgi:hypothetical protein